MRRLRGSWIGGFVAAMALGMSQCGGDAGLDCDAGSLGCECVFAECIGALQCRSGRCVDLGGPDPGTSNPTGVPGEGSDTVDDPTTGAPGDETTNPTTSDPSNASMDPPPDPSTTSGDVTVTAGETSSETSLDPPETTTGEPPPTPDESPYGPCHDDADCEDGAICITPQVTSGVDGHFCAPLCVGPNKDCPPGAPHVEASLGSFCGFGSPTMYCALYCYVGKDGCGPKSDCDDVGFPADTQGTPGVCSQPPT